MMMAVVINSMLSSNIDEELPLFPVDMHYYQRVEGRVKLARTIDKEEHK